MPNVRIPNADVVAAQRIGNANFASTLREVAWRRFLTYYCPHGRDDRSLWNIESTRRDGNFWVVNFDPAEQAVPRVTVSVDATPMNEGTDYVYTGLVVVFSQTPTVDSPVRIRRNGRETVARGNGIQNVFLVPHDPQREHVTAREHELLQTGVHPATEPVPEGFERTNEESLIQRIATALAVPRELIGNAPSTDFRRTIACTQSAIDQRLSRMSRNDVVGRTRAEVAEYLIREGSDLSTEDWRAVEHRETGDGYRVTFERIVGPSLAEAVREVRANAERAIQTVEEAVFGATPAARDIGTWTGTFLAVQDYALANRLVGRPINDVVMRMAREQLGPTRRVVLQPECDMPQQVWRVQHVPSGVPTDPLQIYVDGIALHPQQYTVNAAQDTVRMDFAPPADSVVTIHLDDRTVEWTGNGAQNEFSYVPEPQPPTIRTDIQVLDSRGPIDWANTCFVSRFSDEFYGQYWQFYKTVQHFSEDVWVDILTRAAGIPIEILKREHDGLANCTEIQWRPKRKLGALPAKPLKLKTRRREVEPRAILAEEVPEE